MNMFELWKNKKLPEKIQKEIDSSVSFCKGKEEKIFKAGFMVSRKIKRIRKEMGLDEK